MCGIAALLLQPQARSQEDWQAIREIFTRNLLFNEERGRAATGLATIDIDGRVCLVKMSLPASQFCETVEYHSVLATLGPRTTLLLGHTRLPTKGDPANGGNNHPIQAGSVFGVHNGQIKNDDALFTSLGYPRRAQVDSEIIFRMLATTNPALPPGAYLEQVRPQIELLQGQFTFLACDRRVPQRILVLKHDNPLCVHYHPRWNALVFSSRYIFLRKAFGQSLITETLDHNELMLFDSHQLDESCITPLASLPVFHRATQ